LKFNSPTVTVALQQSPGNARKPSLSALAAPMLYAAQARFVIQLAPGKLAAEDQRIVNEQTRGPR
jgi:hypothetical protein